MTFDEPEHSAAWSLRDDPDSIGAARGHARDFLARGSPPAGAQTVENVLLAVSELVTNAIRHAPGPCTLTMTMFDDHVGIAVSDGSRTVPRSKPADFNGGGGLGLHLLAAVAGRVETVVCPRGKTVSVRVATAAGERCPVPKPLDIVVSGGGPVVD